MIKTGPLIRILCVPCGKIVFRKRVPAVCSRCKCSAFLTRAALMNPAFRQRVDEAITALKRGESATSIRERHGIIVLRQAQELL